MNFTDFYFFLKCGVWKHRGNFLKEPISWLITMAVVFVIYDITLSHIDSLEEKPIAC